MFVFYIIPYLIFYFDCFCNFPENFLRLVCNDIILFDYKDICLFSKRNRVSRAFCVRAYKRDYDFILKIAYIIYHLFIAYRPCAFSVLFPLGREYFYLSVMFFGVKFAKPIRADAMSADDFYIFTTALGNNAVYSFFKQGVIAKMPAAANENS